MARITIEEAQNLPRYYIVTDLWTEASEEHPHRFPTVEEAQDCRAGLATKHIILEADTGAKTMKPLNDEELEIFLEISNLQLSP